MRASLLMGALALLALNTRAADAPPAATRYVQAAAGSSLQFSFKQLDALSRGQFKTFATTLVYDEKNLAASSLDVKITIDSVDTQDGERDAALKTSDLFDVQKFPQATYVARSLSKTAAGGLEAVGKLTLRGVSRDLRLPLTLKPTATGLELSGQTRINRLDYGVGQGEWKSTESVGNEVQIQYRVSLVKAK